MSPIDLAILIMLATLIALCVVIIVRQGRVVGTDPQISTNLDLLGSRVGDVHGVIQAGFAGMREEAGTSARVMREELSGRVDALGASLTTTIGAIGTAQGERLTGFSVTLGEFRNASERHATGLRTELIGNFEGLANGLTARMADQGSEQTRRLDSFAGQLGQHRKAADDEAKALREEVGSTLTRLCGRLTESLEAAATRQAEGLTGVTTAVKDMSVANETRQEALRQTVEGRLDSIRTENAAKLEAMRITVDEKLQGTLEKRLGESFQLVSDRLEQVHKGLGEMQSLATGVGDLKRVLSNVKSRGGWGEVQLGMLLEDMLTRDQYATNVRVHPDASEMVEYAVRLPGRGADPDVPLWLPIDAKFPHEDYDRLLTAQEGGSADDIERAALALERAVRLQAKTICEKYMHPPHTTDFGIMYLPTEGLFAEVIRRPGLASELQTKHRVMVQGPTTLAALLSSLQMGFRTLAIEKRSSEVWQVLGAAKAEFTKYSEVWEKLGKQLDTARRTVDEAGKRTRAVSRRLRSVEALPEAASRNLLTISPDEPDGDQEVGAAVA